MTKKIVRLVSVIFSVIVIAALLCSCNGPKMDEPVNTLNINSSASNVARGYYESVLFNDISLFEKCFPEEFLNDEGVDVTELFNSLRNSNLLDGEFLGSAYYSSVAFTEENGYDYELMRDNISQYHNVDRDLISDIMIVNIKLFIEFEDSTNYGNSDVLCYKYDGVWYYYQAQ